MVDDALIVAGVSKAYGSTQALTGVNVQLRRGEVLGLLGPNGAGKSTLISIVAGILTPDCGSVDICGHDLASEPLAARQLVGVAPQEVGLYLQLPVSANLRFFGEAAGVAKSDLRTRIEQLASSLDLRKILDRRAHQLSGGEKRRVHTAIALLHRPAVLLLDEPTAGVDVHTRRRILDVVRGLAAEGTAICYTTHYLPEAEEIADSATIITGGEVVVSGSIPDLIACEGETTLDITLEGDIPQAFAGMGEVRVDGSVVHLPAHDVGATIASALKIIDHRRVRSIEVIRPSLENVYLSVTGRRIEADAGKGDEG